ncbi:hypothetical protein [Streptomyces sp. NBC_00645]|uniref:hypothetical protein n=1 Tax=Streptomyces sp. NBC_00645 TaxID=2975795 RepID=UPI0032530540
MKDEPPVPECAHWIGSESRYCRSVDSIRNYLPGLCCPLHTPAALAGRPEPQPGPGWPAGTGTRPSLLAESHVHDARAIASGKRRATPADYRAAQAAVDHRSDLNL